MSLLQEIKQVRAEGYLEAKDVFPFIVIETTLSAYNSEGEKVNDGSFDELPKLTATEIRKAVAYFESNFDNVDEIWVDFTYRGASNMQEFRDYDLEIVDGAEQSFMVSQNVTK